MGEISVVLAKDADASAIDDICSLKMQHWPHPMTAQRDWWKKNSAPDDLLVRITKSGTLQAFLRLRTREVISDGKRINALCATEVCVATASQAKGLGRALVGHGSAIIKHRSSCVGYLLCRNEQAGFYSRSGWSRFKAPFSIHSANGNERKPGSDEMCFVFDPEYLLGQTLMLYGDVF